MAAGDRKMLNSSTSPLSSQQYHGGSPHGGQRSAIHALGVCAHRTAKRHCVLPVSVGLDVARGQAIARPAAKSVERPK